MFKLHEDATPITEESTGMQIGWRLVTDDFEFVAEQQEDATVNTYVEWGDDQSGDMANHENWEDAQNWLNVLLTAASGIH